MKLKAAFIGLVLSLAQTAFATILPKNDLHLQDDLHGFSNITEQQFSAAIDEVLNAYKVIVKKNHNATVTPNKLWNDPTVNASAQQFTDIDWQINMYGGLARRPEVTLDGFTMVVCHELGHHIGGFPFYGDAMWASSEGEADYFATQACARLLWKTQTTKNAESRQAAPAIVREKCDAQWNTTAEQNLCYRTSLAGESLAKLLAAIKVGTPVPSFETPDTTVVSSTQFPHPNAQCRLDTYFAGALCTANFNDNLIPGKSFSQRNSLPAEEEASNVSCTEAGAYSTGVRSRCWFKPRLEAQGVRALAMQLQNSQGDSVSRVVPGQAFLMNVKVINRSRLVSNNVTATLATRNPSIAVSNPNSEYGRLVSNETKSPSTPFQFSVKSDAQCGKSATLNFVINSTREATSEAVMFPFAHDVLVGSAQVERAGSLQANSEIPDNSPSGTKSQIDSTLASNAVRAIVSFKVNHRIMSDLTAALVGPSGKRYPIEMGTLRPGANTISTEIEVDEVQARGRWTLNVIDGADKDVGRFLGWDLSLATGRCF